MICKICNQEFQKFGFPSHIKRTHNMNPKEYYDLYIGKPTICICGKETPFMGLNQGYRQFCSQDCSRRNTLIKTREKYGVTNISQVNFVKDKMKKSIKQNWDNLTEEEYNNKCKLISDRTAQYYKEHPKIKKEKVKPIKVHTKREKSKETIEKTKQTNLKKYGTECVFSSVEIKEKIKQTKIDKYNDPNYSNREKYSKTCLDKYGKRSYVETSEFRDKMISNQKDLYSQTHTKSKIENAIMQIIQQYGYTTEPNKHLENYFLDIYIPELNTAIEYNGNYWHSTVNKENNYHLNKSIVCRNNNIRLIHIYEFEDFGVQLKLLTDYLQGHDNYPKNDFNKNNFCTIPKQPEIIYSGKYTIYGAGKLIK